jgi:hypothetical protein
MSKRPTSTPGASGLSAWLSIDETGFYAMPLNCVVVAAHEDEARHLVACECELRGLDASYFTLRPIDLTEPGLHGLVQEDIAGAVEGDTPPLPPA